MRKATNSNYYKKKTDELRKQISVLKQRLNYPKTDSVLEQRFRIEKAIFSISSLFIGDYLLDDSINQALALLGINTQADRVCLYKLHHKAKLFHITSEWINPQSNQIEQSTFSLPAEKIKWLTELLKSKEIIYIPEINSLPDQAVNEKEILTRQHIKSLIAYPIRIKGKTEGFISIDFITNLNPWDQIDFEIFKIAIDIIAFSIERKQSEKSLRKTEHMYQKIFDNAGAATVTLKPDTTIIMVNKEFERLFGIPRNEVEGKKRLRDLVDKKDQATIQRYHYLLLSNPEAMPKNYEFSFVNAEGELRQAFVTRTALLEPKNIVMSFVDITEFKEIEKQLRIAKEKAEESDRLKSAFLANVSHEIRTPLNAITGFSALLAKPDLHPDKKDKYISQIITGSSELVNLIDNVLDISRIESGTLKPKISEFLLNAKLFEIYEFYDVFKLQQGKEDLAIRLILPPDSNNILLKTDPLRLHQILTNLIENAIKFTSSGFVEIGYSILLSGIQNIEKEYILFFVRDSGIGIAKKNKEKIFERFVKIVDKESRFYRGAGLGLTLARDLVHMLEGEIWVESALGKGSTFYFTIPFTRPRITGDKEIKSAVKKPVGLSDKTILIVEDTESNFLYLKEILSSTGAKILRARDGAEAINIFRKNKTDVKLIFMDILMPEYDGFEAANRIRDIENDIIIIAQTAFTFEGELENGLYAGCFDDYILKPFDLKSITKIVERYLLKEKNK